MIPYGHQFIDKKDIEEVVKVLKTDWLTQGPKVGEFEKAVAKYCNVKYAVAVSSGTAALHAATAVAEIGAGDEVITTPLTFAATCNGVIYCGGVPVFADIQEDTLNIDPQEIEKKLTKKTKAIAIVDFAGHPCDLDEIKKIAKKHGLLVIEDAAHSLGSEYKGKRVGGLADLTTLSFHPVKLIATGEGGMVLTNNKKFYEKMKIFRHHGAVKKPAKGPWYYEIEKPGFNYRLTDFQCALGLSQLKKIRQFIKRRREIVSQYNRAFCSVKQIMTPAERNYVKCAWHIYPVQFRLEELKVSRRKLFEELRHWGLGVQVHYMPVHLHPFYKKKFGYKKGDFPKAEKYYQRAITLPLFPAMSEREVQYVIQLVKKVVNCYKR